MARGLLMDGVQQRWAYVSALAVDGPGSEEQLYNPIESFLKAAAPRIQWVSDPFGHEGVAEALPEDHPSEFVRR